MNTNQFLALLRKSNVIDHDRLEKFLEQNPGIAESEELADRLVSAGLLTSFQKSNLLKGKWKGFSIGKYRVLDRLGLGGTGLVYLCEHAVVRRPVAVKVLPPTSSANPAIIERFYREARAAGMLDHPNLVKAHDIDQDGDLHFLVMDYVEGTSLHDLIKRHGALSVERAVEFVRQAALGLQHAHEEGLVHRDIKPSNILLDRMGTIRVLDLGLARFYEDESDPLTGKYNKQNILGTIDYISPEQALNSHEVDYRSDIYSLGATFYYLLAGRPMFSGGQTNQILIWHQVKEPPSIDTVRDDVPEELVAVLMRMLAKNPNQRYQTMAHVLEAIQPWVSGSVAPPTPEEMPPTRSLVRSRAADTMPCIDISTLCSSNSGKLTQSMPTADTEPNPDLRPATPTRHSREVRRPDRRTISSSRGRRAEPEVTRTSGWTWFILFLAVAIGMIVRFLPSLLAP